VVIALKKTHTRQIPESDNIETIWTISNTIVSQFPASAAMKLDDPQLAKLAESVFDDAKHARIHSIQRNDD
jgi:hypothetical protein